MAMKLKNRVFARKNRERSNNYKSSSSSSQEPRPARRNPGTATRDWQQDRRAGREQEGRYEREGAGGGEREEDEAERERRDLALQLRAGVHDLGLADKWDEEPGIARRTGMRSLGGGYTKPKMKKRPRRRAGSRFAAAARTTSLLGRKGNAKSPKSRIAAAYRLS